MKRLTATLILTGLLGQFGLTAAHADFGYANSACWRFVESEALVPDTQVPDKQAPDKQAQDEAKRQWVMGYLSAAARYGSFDLVNSDPKEHLAAVLGFCVANPKHSLEAAVRRAVLHEE